MTATPTPLRELLAMTLQHVRLCAPDATIEAALEAALSARDAAGAVDPERVAQLIAHRACCGVEHDPANGKLHGYCVVCGVEWPCEYAGKPPIATPPASAGAVYRCDYCGSDYTDAKYCCQARREYLNAHGEHETATPPAASGDDFNGDNAKLIGCIEALLSLDAANALVPHGIGGHARTLLFAAARRLAAVAPPASGEAEAWDSLAIAHLLDERASDRGGDKLLTDAAALIRRLAAVAPPAASGGEPWSTISDSQVEAYIEHRSGLTKTLAKALRDTREHYRRLAAVAPASDHIDAMVNRFLGWRLPDDFAPDNGISYAPIPRHPDWTHDTHPTGTNLFHAGQARAMFAHCVAAVAPAGMVLVPRKQIEELAEILGDGSTTTSSGLPVTVLELIDAQQGAAGELRRMLAAAPTPPATAGQE